MAPFHREYHTTPGCIDWNSVLQICLKHAVFIRTFDEGPDVFRLRMFQAHAGGETEAAAGADCFNQVPAVMLHLFCSTCGEQGPRHVTTDAGPAAQLILSRQHISP